MNNNLPIGVGNFKTIREEGLFYIDFDKLISEGEAMVSANLECSFIELQHRHTLWGLLINSGYATVISQENEFCMKVRIPNGEVKSEFIRIISVGANIKEGDLHDMFKCLMSGDMDGFIKIYQKIVMSCTSYYDAKENAYHMLFLGMCISLNSIYKITSNLESGHRRSDIIMQSLSNKRPHIVIEFKQGEDIDELKNTALEQIHANKYYEGLKGEVMCIGIAHDKKRCEMVYTNIWT